jgi:hypothetical protein
MNTRSRSFLDRVIGAITRGTVPNYASQCDGPCVVHAPSSATKAQSEGESNRQSPIRWVSLR